MDKKYRMFSRQDKGQVFMDALDQSGYTQVTSWRNATLILGDHDQRGELRNMIRQHKPFFIHPHSARSMILWDGIIPPTSFTSCNFVFAPGHKQVMLKYGYRRPIEVIGWTYSPILPFKPSKELRRVLFAPIHPNAGVDRQGRRLMELDKQLNANTFQVLYKLLQYKVLDQLVVRYSGVLEDNGLTYCPDVTYEKATLTLTSSIQSIQSGYDVIVSHQTFAYLAVALGIPTVMFGEWVPPHSMSVTVKSWDQYKKLLMYPLDLLDGNPRKVLENAIACDEPIREWKHNFIGSTFHSSYFVQLVEKYL